MSAEIGAIVPGTVVRLAPYGAFIRLESGETGLVHISEIDRNYVRSVEEHLRIDDAVTVKVLGVKEDGKIDLSIKQAALQAANARLAYERGRLNDPAYVEQLAQQDFHMVRPGEQPWLLTGTPPADKVAKAAAKPSHEPPWYQRAWRWLRGRSH